MSTKARIQKVRAEVEAHEERGWLKGYEEGLAKREQQIVDLQNALEARNERIGELSRQKKGLTTAREALALAWELAHPVREGQEVQVGTELIARFEDGDFRTYRAKKPFEGTSEPGWAETRTLDPLPDPEPDWLDAPAVLAKINRSSSPYPPDEFLVWAPCKKGNHAEEGGWAVPGIEACVEWRDLRDVTPLYPKEGQDS